jgi:hypothetical protein
MPTKGPIGLQPSTADGIQLNVLSGLLNDTPIFNGDFADPFALRTADDLYMYASNTQTAPHGRRPDAQAHRGDTELGGESRRGTVDDPERQRLLALLLGQPLGTDAYGIGVARCSTVVGPCAKPLDHAWLSTAASGGQTDPGPGGQEFFQVGGLTWMVHHGLAPGQSGNAAQRRLYVDLLAFPGDRTPHLAPRAPAAALAEALLYFGDPNVPPQPDQAFLALLHKVPSAFAHDTDQALVADGHLACAGLTHEQAADDFIDSLIARGLNEFEASLVGISATEYFCPKDSLQALNDVQEALSQGSN